MSKNDRHEGLSLTRHEARGLTVIIILIIAAVSVLFTLKHCRHAEFTAETQTEVNRFAVEVESCQIVSDTASTKVKREKTKRKTSKKQHSNEKSAKPARHDHTPSVMPNFTDKSI